MSEDTPLHQALRGDDEAIEEVLGSIVAPLFDLALHLEDDAKRAEESAVNALKALVRDFRAGALPCPDPLDAGARRLLEEMDRASVTPSPPGTSELGRKLAKLDPFERRTLLVALSLDTGGEALACALDAEPLAARNAREQALAKLGMEEPAVRDALDQQASAVPLPRGMIDRALDEQA